MPDTLQIEIVTPERLLVKETTEAIQVPAAGGYIGVLPGHAPLLTQLSVGEIAYRSGGNLRRFAVAWGFAEILPDRVTIMAEVAEHPSEIDVARAKRDKTEAEGALRNAGSDQQAYDQAAAKLQEAETRIQVAEGTGWVANLVP